jgi:hypothetical protein
MIRIAISVEAFDAIAATLPVGSVGFRLPLCADDAKLRWRGIG